MFHSKDPSELNADYSRWRDVYLTLQGLYGARSTKEFAEDETSSVMHVAAPIMDGGEIVGVVTVFKANKTVQPFIDATSKKVKAFGFVILFLSLLFGFLFSRKLAVSIGKLLEYCLLYTSPSPRDATLSRMPSSA